MRDRANRKESKTTMKLRHILRTLVIVLSTCFGSVLLAQNDNIPDRLVLKSGGELIGRIQSESKEDGKNFILFETESGGILKLDANRLVRSTLPGDGLATEYAVRAGAATSPAEHWQVIEWCQDQKSGRSRFRNEIKFHLEQIVEADPNDKKAWVKLGYVRRDNVWIQDEKEFAVSGYERVKGKWKSNQLAEVSTQLNNNDQTRRAGVIAFVKWQKSLSKVNAATARADLFTIINPSVVPSLYEFSREHNNRDVRRLAVEAIATVNSPLAMNALVNFAIQDPAVSIRQAAAASLEHEKHFAPEQVAGMVVSGGFLQHKQNKFVENAGRLLREVQSDAAILPLINALQTTHEVSTGNEPGRTRVSQTGGNIDGFSVGGGPATREVVSSNQAVAGALRAITGQEFRFDEVAATAWYIENYSHTEMDLRGSD